MLCALLAKGFTVQKALSYGAARFQQHAAVCGCFHAFGHHVQTQVGAQLGNGLNDGVDGAFLLHAVDKLAVNLQGVDRGVAQVGE